VNWLAVLALVPDQDLLRQPVRRHLMGLIRRRPGIHASEICRESGEAWGTVQYHLSLLKTGELIQTVEAGRALRFFPQGEVDEVDRLTLIVGQGRRTDIAQYIRDNPGIRQVDVCNAVGVSRKTLRASVAVMMQAGLISERKGLQSNRYFPEAALETVLGPAGESSFDVA
jgi:predicted transcriptional regulator